MFWKNAVGINKHDFLLHGFVQLPVVKNSNDVINFWKLYKKIEIGVRNLDCLDVKKESYGNLLISLINAWLPEDLCLHLCRIFKNNKWNLDELLNFLKTDVEAKEHLSTSYSSQ